MIFGAGRGDFVQSFIVNFYFGSRRKRTLRKLAGIGRQIDFAKELGIHFHFGGGRDMSGEQFRQVNQKNNEKNVAGD
jgi:hypothetical protein